MGKQKKIPDDNQSTHQPDQSSTPVYHVPVLLTETIDGLNIEPGGIYVDCTFGGGGHSRALLEKLNENGKIIAFDQDEDARKNVPDDKRIIFVPYNFRHLQRLLRLNNIHAVDGIMADLGVSSHQFDEVGRGFSYRFDAAMNMRMDQRQSLTAFEVVNNYSEQQLHKLFEQYGEVTNAKTLAKTIVNARLNMSLKTIESFRNAIREIVKGNPNKYFAQVFQALRIEVNDELGAIKEMLRQVPPLLKPGGRAVIITFHSLEDRLVKNFFRQGRFEEPELNPFINEEKVNELRPITKKPILPSEKELKLNPRSRSAKLRIAEKVMMV
jgi:16S rRNA (cytosine1402-N4)-methyltransferase